MAETTETESRSTTGGWQKGLATIVVLVVAYAIARGVLFPSVALEQTVEIQKGNYYQFAYTPKTTNRKFIVDVESLNGIGVEVAIISQENLKLVESGRLSLSEAVADVEGAYSPSLVKRSVARYITTDKNWVVIMSARNAGTQVKIKAKTLLRF